MNTGNIVTLGAVAVGGYLAYQWYYGPGGQADQAVVGNSLTAAQLQALSAQVTAAAAAQGVTPAAYIAAITPTAANQVDLAAARVAVTEYPTAAATTTAVAVSTPSPVVAVAPPAVVTPASSSGLDAMYQSLKAAAAPDAFFSGSGDSLSSSVDHWNVYLQRLVSTPIPGGMFSNVSGDDSNNLTAAQYWAVMAPWVASTTGLSGLGIFGGLGALVMGRR